MQFNEYQAKARETAIYIKKHVTREDVFKEMEGFDIYSSFSELLVDRIVEARNKYVDLFNLVYPILGLVGEASEVAEKFKKILRDKNGVMTEEDKKNISMEVSDVFWYQAAIASELGFDLNNIAQSNLDKLFSRKERGKLGGSGDSR